MKKVFEIWMDDEAEFINFTGTICQRTNTNGISVSCFNNAEYVLKRINGYYISPDGKSCEIKIDIDKPNIETLTEIKIDDLSVRTFNAVKRAGFKYYEDFTLVREKDVKHIGQIGKRSYEELVDVINKKVKEFEYSKTDIPMKTLQDLDLKQGDIVRYTGSTYKIVGVRGKNLINMSRYACSGVSMQDTVTGNYISVYCPNEVITLKLLERRDDNNE